MKKTIALLLMLAVMLAGVFASAQEIEIHREDAQFYMVVALPSGARVESSQTDDNFSLTVIGYIAPGKPSVEITTAATELYVGLSLSDLSREDVERIVSDITVEMADPKTELRATPDGFEYVVANEQAADNDTCDTVMLVNGFFIMVKVYYPGHGELTPEDELIGPSIVDSFRFVGNTNS